MTSVLAYPGTGSNVSNSGIPWSSPNLITVEDSATSQATSTGAWGSDFLVGSDFGFAVPITNVIDGILVEGREPSLGAATGNREFTLSANTGSTSVGIAKNPGGSIVSGWLYWAAGGPADRWGFSPTAAIVNSPAFAARLRVTAVSGFQTFKVDWLRVTVFHSLPGGSGSTASILIFT